MVFVKVRETYDLHTLRNKMSVIGVHTPRPGIVRRNYPGLLLQCKAWRPVSVDVRMACASMLPLDPQGVGTTEGDVAPEDVFNPILYKAVSNFSMSQIEAFINSVAGANWTSTGDSLEVDNNGISADDFNLYYGFLSDTNGWKHAAPQSGLSMNNLRPLVYEQVYSVNTTSVQQNAYISGEPTSVGAAITPDGSATPTSAIYVDSFRGKAKPMPWLPTTVPVVKDGALLHSSVGFPGSSMGQALPDNYEAGTPSPKIFCGLILIPPSRLHQLFYRMVVEWTLEFSTIRSLSEITNFGGVASIGSLQHLMDYSFESRMLTEETELVDTTDETGIHKVM